MQNESWLLIGGVLVGLFWGVIKQSVFLGGLAFLIFLVLGLIYIKLSKILIRK
jgi:uncharacterized membrane protein